MTIVCWQGASSSKPSENCKRILYIILVQAIYVNLETLLSINDCTSQRRNRRVVKQNIDEVSQFSLEHSRNSVNIGEKKNLYFAAAGAQTQCSKRLGPVAGGHDYLA